MRVSAMRSPDGRVNGYAFDCPGCREYHMITTGSPNAKDNWTFNYDMNRPTFSPSLLVRWRGSVCHSFVRNGQIQFLSDCTHSLKNKTVDLPEVPCEVP